jgi:hypothetical protein
MKYGKIYFIVSILTVGILLFFLTRESIPIVTIGYNNLHFLKNFINQIKKFNNPIIVFDNKSTYAPMFEYYKEIKQELGSKIQIRLMDKNYGSAVYLRLRNTLPKKFILSDSDLFLNPKMPQNFSDILYNLSNKYKAYKIGLALDISDKEKFLKCDNYINGKSIYDWEKEFWKKKIQDPNYELYSAPTDTTFCLINDNYIGGPQIRIAGNFTAKHLPWYKNYLRNHIPADELESWKHKNNSSGILLTCDID